MLLNKKTPVTTTKNPVILIKRLVVVKSSLPIAMKKIQTTAVLEKMHRFIDYTYAPTQTPKKMNRLELS